MALPVPRRPHPRPHRSAPQLCPGLPPAQLCSRLRPLAENLDKSVESLRPPLLQDASIARWNAEEKDSRLTVTTVSRTDASLRNGSVMRHSGPLLPPTSDRNLSVSSAFSAQQQRAFALRTSIGSRTSDRSEPIMPRSRGNSAAELEQAGGGMPGGSQGAEHKAD